MVAFNQYRLNHFIHFAQIFIDEENSCQWNHRCGDEVVLVLLHALAGGCQKYRNISQIRKKRQKRQMSCDFRTSRIRLSKGEI